MNIFGFIKNSSERRFLIVLAVIILLVRVGYVLTLENKWYFYDTVHYDTAAQHIVKGEGFGPSIYFSNVYANYCLEPVYPLFLASVYAVFGHSLLAARMAQAFLGLLTLVLFYLLGKEVMPKSAARWILIIGAFYPFFIYLAGFLYITQVFTFFVALSLWAFSRYYRNYGTGWLILAAAATGIAVLCRPVYLVAVPLLVIWLMFFTRQKFLKRGLAAVLLGLVLLAVFTPWTVRNYKVFNRAKYARACLPQGLVYGKTFWDILQEKTMAQDTTSITSFAFACYDMNEKSFIDCYVNDDYFFTLNPYDKMTMPDSGGYIGMLFSGPWDNHVERTTAWQRTIANGDTTLTPMFDSVDSLAVIWKHESIQYTPPDITFKGTGRNWDYGIFFNTRTCANYFTIEYPEGLSPKQLHRAALLIYLDRPSPDANGYMVWLHPWKEPDLWWFRDGKAFDSVPVIKAFAQDNDLGLFYLLKKYPIEYIFKHFIPEFLNFWSPKIIRVKSEGLQPGTLLQTVAVLTFAPILLLFPVGFWALRKQWQLLALFLIPVISLSCGYALYFSQTRYRIPVDGFMVLFAVMGIYALVTRIKSGNRNV